MIIFPFFFVVILYLLLKFFIAAFSSYLMLFYVDLLLNGSFAIFFPFCNRKKTCFFFFRSLYHYQNIFQMCFILLCHSKILALHTHGVLALLALLQRCHIELN